MVELQVNSRHSSFGGVVGFYQYQSQVCNGPMRFSVYEPPQMKKTPVPVVYFLSGLTCTEENFMAKAGAQRYAAALGLCLVVPDTSPRERGISDENKHWTFGSGAGFYLDATQSPWVEHYQMYRFVADELPAVIQANFSVRPDRQSITGHSMGGHGALVLGLRNPQQYRAISAFAPIANPTVSDWTQDAFRLYLGDDRSQWNQYDASCLVQTCIDERPILIDQGLADQFLEELRPDAFEQACHQVGRKLTLRRHQGYDHGYYFIASFVGDHLKFHAEHLKG